MVYTIFPVDVIETYRFTIEDKLCTKQRSTICCNGPSKGVVSLDGGGKFTSGGVIRISGV